MVEWHVTPDYIVNNWTDELLDLMVEKLVERKKREEKMVKPEIKGEHKVPERELFSRAKHLIKVIKRGH